VATENKLSDTSENIFNTNESVTQGNNSDTVITDKGPKNTHVLSSEVKSECITVIACCKASDQFLFPALLHKDVNKKTIWVTVYS
jgi:hypothetical protein